MFHLFLQTMWVNGRAFPLIREIDESGIPTEVYLNGEVSGFNEILDIQYCKQNEATASRKHSSSP